MSSVNYGLDPTIDVKTRAGKNLRFFKTDFRFLGFNVCTGARGTLDTRIRSRRMPTRRLTHALRYKKINNSNSNEFK